MPVKLNELSKKVFDDRYALKNDRGEQIEKTPEEMWRRVANHIASVEWTDTKRQHWAEQFYGILDGFKYVPGGRVLTGAGTGVNLTYYNCYVIPSPEDSRSGIFDNVRMMVEIMSRGGGVGVNLSTLRPSGSYVKGVNGTASGAVSFGGLYSYATGLITQGGSRRGALMLMLDDNHPDIEEFITVKRTMGLVTNANLSVCVSDKFMEAVKADADWNLEWQGKVHKTVKASYLWNLICESAWASGEPGMVFIERCNKEANSWYFQKLISVNPCVTGDTLVYTRAGLKKVKELDGQNVEITMDSRLSTDKFLKAKVFKTGAKPVYALKTSEGYELKLTADHQVRTETCFVEAKNLRAGDKILLLNQKGGFGQHGNLEVGNLIGWFIGDGHFTAGKGAILSFFGTEKQELGPLFQSIVNNMVVGVGERAQIREYPISLVAIKNRDEVRISSLRLATVLAEYGVQLDHKLVVPTSVLAGSEAMQRGFLQGLFTADGQVSGTIQKGVSARLTSISLELLQDAQRLLLNFGIASKIYQNRRVAGERLMPDGHGGEKMYHCQSQHDLVVSRENLIIFEKEIGFLTTAKQGKLKGAISQFARGPYRETFTATFEELAPLGEETVYDLNVPEVHAFVANGLVVHNCGEQPLDAWGVCNLGAVNLSVFVRDQKIDYENLGKTVRTAVRFMDNVIDATPYLFEDNRKAQMGTRRIGLGTMGLGDMLIKMKIKYGSSAAVELCDEIYKFIRDESYWASVEIAREKGSFPHFDREKFNQGQFIKRLPEELQTAIYTYGIRNCFLLTQAPTGTTSILAGVSSGIEPVYDFVVIRKDRLGEHEMVHPLYQEWRTAHPDEPLPEYFTTAKELTPEEHIVMQAVAQKYTDSSISKTVNAPNDHTIVEVKTLYQKAYDLGCKGVTYYRDGSRDMSVLQSKSDVDKQETRNKKQETNGQEEANEMPAAGPVPRPSVTSGSTYKIKTGYGSLFVTVNNDNRGLPFEVFATVGKTGGFFAAKSEAICRLVSLALRSGVSAEHVIEQLRGIRGPMPSFSEYGQVLSIPDAISKILDAHTKGVGQNNISLMHEAPVHPAEQAQLAEPEVLKFEEVKSALGGEHGMQRVVATKVAVAERGFAPECPNCSSVLNMSEGCMTCPGCGFSKCG